MTVIQSKLLYELGCPLGYQGPRRDSSAPREKCTRMSQLNVLQINIEGLQHKTTELFKMLHDNDVHIVILQETILPRNEVSTPGYTPTKCECTNCRGIMTLVRNDVQAEVKNSPAGDIDIQQIKVWLGKIQYSIFNIYCPPKSTTSIPLEETTYKKCIIAGDFNAHTPSLGLQQERKGNRRIVQLFQLDTGTGHGEPTYTTPQSTQNNQST